MPDPEKRKKIMERSKKLGHCICNPGLECPCPAFLERDICSCAGEKPQAPAGRERLTRLSENPGCASKIKQADLARILSSLPPQSDPRVLVGSGTCDDAGVFLLEEGSALVQSVDVFTPNLDDPGLFGQVAAANSLSDIYAMGAKPLTALSVIAFPLDRLPGEVMSEILRGGIEKMAEAGVPVIGGHSIRDSEVKFGFAVTGLVDPGRVVTNAGLRPGDDLVLTKPIGTGVISFAAQSGRASPESLAAIARSMTGLNGPASAVMLEIGVSACTDVTGFGLLGHLSGMAVQAGVTVEITAESVPLFPGAAELVRRGYISGAAEHNREYADRFLEDPGKTGEETLYLLADPQTSGGLLVGVEPGRTGLFLEKLGAAGVKNAAVIGRVSGRSSGRIIVRGDCFPGPAAKSAGDQSLPAAPADCCAAPPGAAPEAGEEGESARKFAAFMASTSSGGCLSGRERELVALALSILSRCEPCARLHLEKAREAGLGEEAISAALWMAVSFGGAPVRAFCEAVAGKGD